ncbi:MAG TPA: transporter substrate-binding domain-containing protein [Vicinamibacteria bacterium]|nr:transporter substrate-binding domain-containing protein [Vicinamibacteria bacterium]
MLRRSGFLFFTTLFLTQGAAVPTHGQEWPVLERIVKTGKIRVGMSGDQAPFNVRSRSGELIGFEVDLVRMMAQSMGVFVEYVAKPFPELLPALKAGDVDIVMSGMAITAERSLEAVFVGPYLMSGKSLLTNDPALAEVTRTEDINQTGLTIATLRNSTSQAFAEKHLPIAKLVTVETYDEGIQMVVDDEVDALVADMPACNVAVLRYPDRNLMTLSAPFTVEPIGIAVRATELPLQSLLDNYVEAYKESGIVELLQVQWLESGDWISELP